MAKKTSYQDLRWALLWTEISDTVEGFILDVITELRKDHPSLKPNLEHWSIKHSDAGDQLSVVFRNESTVVEMYFDLATACKRDAGYVLNIANRLYRSFSNG